MYKVVFILYVIIFSSYVLFTRIPDYFEGEFIKGVVSKASFSEETNEPELLIDYRVGNEKLQHKTNSWFLTPYKQGQQVTIIYNPSDPAVSSIYAFIGYWIKWQELIYTSVFFVILFLAAKSIVGHDNSGPAKSLPRKRKYDE
ncbi:hypothetical protein [Segetibacter aerophilus]|uniref:DUF3592 domain-containing protein n=1 Tax=Segetibacter aerophilus TaxID=670293 RepID=A0A512BAH5_9BACT|nr:hypothetical protein [Segetibacter aerophilus]GEO08949.1 hypothetical protein SAE01_14450 [Segetibacter aerophilus]